MLHAHEIRKVAVLADDSDPRTVARFLRGEPVRPVCAARIRAALQRLGYAHVEPASAGLNASELAPVAGGGMR